MSDGKDEQEQVEQATEPAPEPGVRQDARGERFPDPTDGDPDSDESAQSTLEMHRRHAERLEEHGEAEGDTDE